MTIGPTAGPTPLPSATQLRIQWSITIAAATAFAAEARALTHEAAAPVSDELRQSGGADLATALRRIR